MTSTDLTAQISIAKMYPRNRAQVLRQIVEYATLDAETAALCFYGIKNEENKGDDEIIDGLTVRMAEIMAIAWGNLTINTKIVANDGKSVTAQATCYDLENNVTVSVEAVRSITDKDGKPYLEGMQTSVCNTATSIAFRNAVLKVIPKTATLQAVKEILVVARGNMEDLADRTRKLVSDYANISIYEQQICTYLHISNLKQLDQDKLFRMRSLLNAILEGTTTVAEAFPVKEVTVTQKKERLKGKKTVVELP